MIYFALVRANVVKIGMTTEQDLTTRIRRLKSKYRHPVTLLAFCEGDRETERFFHRKFAAYRLGKPEHFRASPELLGYIGCPLLMEMPAGARIKPIELESPSQRSVA